jgi:hypothetical protein
VIATFPESSLAVAGDVVWVVSGWDIQRYVDTGTAFLMTAALVHPEGFASFLLASADELVAVHDRTLALYTFSAGALTTAGATPWNQPYTHMGTGGPQGLFLREDSKLALVALRSTDVALEIEVCPYQLDSGRIQRTLGTCTRLQGDVVGFEPRVLWTLDPPAMVGARLEQGILHRWEWIGGRLVEQGSVSLGVHARLASQRMSNPSIVPVIHAAWDGVFSGEHTAVALWSTERRAIFFEHLDAEVVHPNASPTFYSGVTAQTTSPRTTKIRLRSQAPIR